jgi:hypothetical protein
MKRFVMLLGVAVVVGACGVVDAVDDMVDESVFDMQPGLCFDDEATETDEVATVPDRDCDEPHDNEVFAVVDLGGGEYPGQDELFAQADEICSGAAFDDYVGIAYLDSELEVSSYVPTAEGWDDGDYEVVCYLFNLDLSKLDATMEGAQR